MPTLILFVCHPSQEDQAARSVNDTLVKAMQERIDAGTFGSIRMLTFPEHERLPDDALEHFDRVLRAETGIVAVITYDESLVLRSIRRVLDGTLSAKDFRVFYWHPGSAGTDPRLYQVDIDSDVRFSGLPHNIWQRSLEEAADIFDLRKARGKD